MCVLVGIGLSDHGYEGVDEADRWSEPWDWGKLGRYLGGPEEDRGGTRDCGQDRHGWSRGRGEHDA